jgi:hypothetical protein
VHVDRLVVESDAQTVGVEFVATETRAQRRQRSAQRASCALRVGVGPQQCRDGVASLGLTGDGQIRDERRGLPRVQRDRAPTTLDAGSSEEAQDRSPGHRGALWGADLPRVAAP